MRDMLYLNGTYGPVAEGSVSVEDRGFLFGDGVYEVVKVFGGRPLWLPEHLERLAHSLAQIRLEIDRRRHPLEDVIPALVEGSGLAAEAGSGLVYVQVTRGPSPRDFAFPVGVEPTVVAFARSFAFPDEERILRGVTLFPLRDIRWDRCDIKSTNLLGAVLAKNEARDAGFDEALWLGPDEVVREGGSSNVFAVVDGALRTHPADNHILNGITRQTILRLARSLGLTVLEEPVTLSELARADECFIASTTNDVMPALRVGAHVIRSGRPGPTTLALVDALRSEAAGLAGLPAPPPLGR